MYQALFFSLSSQRSKEAKNKKKITPDLRLFVCGLLVFRYIHSNGRYGSADLKKGDEVGEQRHARGDIGRYPIPKINAVSVFRRLLTRYFEIYQFFSRYCGI